MRLEEYIIQRVVLDGEDEDLDMEEIQQKRLKELENKLAQYESMMHRFIEKYKGRGRKHHEKDFYNLNKD